MEPARVFGPSTHDSLASFDPDTCLWRTSQLSLLGALSESLRTWPRSGMTRSGIAYQRRPLAPLTDAIASGSLPTPKATDADKGGRGDLLAVVRTGKTSRRSEWPTPHGRHSEALLIVVAMEEGPGRLNPRWVEWLMGFPIGWTLLEPSETPSFPQIAEWIGRRILSYEQGLEAA